MISTKEFLDSKSKEQSLRERFPDFDEFPPEKKEDIRRCYANINKAWARYKLHVVYDLDCDSDNCGQCGNYGAYAGGDPPLKVRD